MTVPSLQGNSLPSRHSTHGSHSMRPLVEAQTPAVPKGLSADAAGVRLLARVDAEVTRQSPGVAEACVADGAAVGPLARVDALMDLQVLHAVEVAAAQGAVVGAAARREEALLGAPDVVFAVPAQLLGQTEGLAAHLAHVLASRMRGIRLILGRAGRRGGRRVPVLIGFGERRRMPRPSWRQQGQVRDVC